MTHEFDEAYWQEHWQQRPPTDGADLRPIEPNPYRLREPSHLTSGTALDAGCGEGDEAIWLAASGWQVTGADISINALVRAADRASVASHGMQLRWIEADLTQWAPEEPFDLVTTFYAHPSTPQLAFYQRIAQWVAPGGTLLIVGHLHDSGHPGEASVTAAEIVASFEPQLWTVITSEESERTVVSPSGIAQQLRDVIVRAGRVA